MVLMDSALLAKLVKEIQKNVDRFGNTEETITNAIECALDGVLLDHWTTHDVEKAADCELESPHLVLEKIWNYYDSDTGINNDVLCDAVEEYMDDPSNQPDIGDPNAYDEYKDRSLADWEHDQLGGPDVDENPPDCEYWERH